MLNVPWAEATVGTSIVKTAATAAIVEGTNRISKTSQFGNELTALVTCLERRRGYRSYNTARPIWMLLTYRKRICL